MFDVFRFYFSYKFHYTSTIVFDNNVRNWRIFNELDIIVFNLEVSVVMEYTETAVDSICAMRKR